MVLSLLNNMLNSFIIYKGSGVSLFISYKSLLKINKVCILGLADVKPKKIIKTLYFSEEEKKHERNFYEAAFRSWCSFWAPNEKMES